jgi:hypothetical protein
MEITVMTIKRDNKRMLPPVNYTAKWFAGALPSILPSVEEDLLLRDMKRKF